MRHLVVLEGVEIFCAWGKCQLLRAKNGVLWTVCQDGHQQLLSPCIRMPFLSEMGVYFTEMFVIAIIYYS